LKDKKIFLYSHDTFGLGHIRRSLKIANALKGAGVQTLIANACSKASSFKISNGIDFLNLPGYQKMPNGSYIPRKLDMTLEDLIKLRSDIFFTTIKSYRPDVILIDKEPLGVGRELEDSLKYVREHLPETKVICGFRDILDSKEQVATEWGAKGIKEALEKYYDLVLVYGQKDFFDFEKEYSIGDELRKKIIYTGYIHPLEKEDIGDEALEEKELAKLVCKSSRPLVTLTLGGGGDGWEFFDKFVDYVSKQTRKDTDYFILSGPYIEPKLFELAQSKLEGISGVHLVSFLSNTRWLFERSDVIFSMGGYNTLTELASLGKKVYVWPRTQPRLEQSIRASIFEKQELIKQIHDSNFSTMIEEALIPRNDNKLKSRGLEKVVQIIEALIRDESLDEQKETLLA
jgi:predicted glycosyltransferase